MLQPAPLNEIRSVAQKLKYDPNTNDYHLSVVLNLKGPDVASKIVVSFHGVGVKFRDSSSRWHIFKQVTALQFRFRKTSFV